MKIQCDFCRKQEATVFCLADEAALCDVCDRRVHRANKIASRHERFPLLGPSPSNMPLCDICQERRAILFCQQDKAILCRDCDPIIHRANEHTHTHNRFLLAGIKLSTTATISSTSTDTTKTTATANFVTEEQHHSLHPINFNAENKVPLKLSSTAMDYDGGSTSTISDYLTKILPGWKVEDLFDSIASPPKFCELHNRDDDARTLSDVGLYGRVSSRANYKMWVPERAEFHSHHDQQRALPDLLRKINTEKLIGSHMKSSLFQKSAQCVGFKRKRRLL